MYKRIHTQIVKVLTTRVDRETIDDLDAIGKEEGTDRSEIARRLLKQSIKEWKLERALRMISSSEWTIRRASEFAGVPYHRMVQEMASHGVDSGPRVEDLGQQE